MGKIILPIFVFIVLCFLFTALMFPIDKVVGKAIDKMIVQSHKNIKYNTLSAGFFKTRLEGIEYTEGNKFYYIDSVELRYCPFALVIMKKFKGSINSPFGDAEFKFKKNNIDIHGVLNLKTIGSLAKVDIAPANNDVNIDYNFTTKKGTFNIKANDITAKSILDINIKDITSEGHLENNVIYVDSFKSKGDVIAEVTGVIVLNLNSIYDSVINLNGPATLLGVNQNVRINSTLRNIMRSLGI